MQLRSHARRNWSFVDRGSFWDVEGLWTVDMGLQSAHGRAAVLQARKSGEGGPLLFYTSPSMPRLSERFANYAQIRSHIPYASCSAARPIIPKHKSMPTNHSPLRA